MECNRDEAIRAKTIAEKKLADKDFAGAKKFTLKAHTLYPELDGISQMFTILDVYISAEKKVSGEVDWYGILGVNPSDDDETIRKQYRKLSLILHPDKNKSVGAGGAFKLLSEAWSLLSDKAKRLAYNHRRTLRGCLQKVPSQIGGPPPVFDCADTFWTICHRCKMHYEYHKVYLKHTLLCTNCHKPFLAKETAPPVNFSRSAHSSAHQQHHDLSNRASSGKPVTNQYNPGIIPAATHNSEGAKYSHCSNNNTNSFLGPFCNTDPSIASKAADVVQRVNERLRRDNTDHSIASKAADVQLANERLRRDNTDPSIASKAAEVVQLANETSRRDNTDPSIASKAAEVVQLTNERLTRENTDPSIASKAADVVQRVNERLRRDNTDHSIASKAADVQLANERLRRDNTDPSIASKAAEVVQLENETSRRDNTDPSIASKAAEVVQLTNERLTRENTDPSIASKAAEVVQRVNERLRRDNTDHSIASKAADVQLANERLRRDNTDPSIASKAAKVVQLANETSRRDNTDPSIASKAAEVVQLENERLTRDNIDPSIASKAAEVVQRVSERLRREREESSAGWPSKNRKVDGSEQSSFRLRTTVFETDGAYGFYSMNNKINNNRELSPLEIRTMLMQKAQKEICRKISEWLSEEVESNKADHTKTFMGSNGNCASFVKKGLRQTMDTQEHQEPAMMVPDPDFHDFDFERTENSFQDNQVWAAYDDEDGMPRFYALVHKVFSRSPLKMKISWLNSKTTTEFGQINWIGCGFSKTCGEFRVGRHELYTSLNSFSQKVEWTKTPRGSVLIYPRKGEVWALYRNWSHDWNEHVPDNVIHQYEMVEVVDDYNEEQGVAVSPLVKFAGFRTVFHPRTHESEVKKIIKEEMFRFSHQVPKHLLTGEEGYNSPKGCLELDPAATSMELPNEA